MTQTNAKPENHAIPVHATLNCTFLLYSSASMEPNNLDIHK